MKRSLTSAAVALIFFSSNVALGYSAETNLWADRRARALKTNENVAALPLQPAKISAVLNATLPSRRSLESVIGAESGHFGASTNLTRALSAIPASAATVRRIYPARGGNPGRGAVVLIQDVHLNMEAQENIWRTLAALQTSAPTGTRVGVGVEGAFGNFNFDRFSGLPDSKLAGKVAHYFLTSGRIAAPTYLGVLGGAPAFSGVDDAALYAMNRVAVRDAGSFRRSALEVVSRATREINDQKRAALNPDLLRFDNLLTGHRDGSIALGPYVERLAEINRGAVPKAVESFLEAFKIERAIDYAAVERERRHVIEKIVAAASPEDIKRLIDESVRYRSGNISYAEFHRVLSSIAERRGVSISNSPAFAAYVRYVALADAIRAEALFDGIATLEKSAIAKLSTSDVERQILRRDEAAFLAGRLVAFSLTPDEWREYRDIKKFSPLSPKMAASFEAFYVAADLRSNRIVKNVLAMPATDGIRGLLVGGFHTQVIAARLAARGVDVAVVQPVLTKVEGLSGTEYLSIFAREKAPIEKILNGEKLFLAPSELEVGDPSNPASRITEDLMIHFTLAASALAGQAGTFPSGSSRLDSAGGVTVVTTRTAGKTLQETAGRTPAGFVEVSAGLPAPSADAGVPALTFLRPQNASLVLDSSRRIGQFLFGRFGRIIEERLTRLVVASIFEIPASLRKNFLERHTGDALQQAQRAIGISWIRRATYLGLAVGAVGALVVLAFLAPQTLPRNSIDLALTLVGSLAFVLGSSALTGAVLNAATHGYYNHAYAWAALTVDEPGRAAEGSSSGRTTDMRLVIGGMRHWMLNAFAGSVTYVDLLEPGEEARESNLEMLGYMQEGIANFRRALDAFDASRNAGTTFYRLGYEETGIYATKDTPGYLPENLVGAPTVTGAELTRLSGLEAVQLDLQMVRSNAERLFHDANGDNGLLTPAAIARIQERSKDLRLELNRLIRGMSLRADYIDSRGAEAPTASQISDRERMMQLLSHELGNRLMLFTAAFLSSRPGETRERIAARVAGAVAALARFREYLAHFRPDADNTTPFYPIDSNSFHLFATPDTTIYGNQITPKMTAIPGAEMVRRTGTAVVYQRLRVVEARMAIFVDRFQTKVGLTEADVQDATALARDISEEFRNVSEDYAQTTRIMQEDLASREPAEAVAPTVTVETDHDRIENAPVTAHREWMLALFADEIFNAVGDIRTAISVASQGNPAGFDAADGAIASVERFLKEMDTENGGKPDFYLVREGENELYQTRNSARLANRLDPDLAPVAGWKIEDMTEVAELSARFSGPVGLLRAAIATARTSGNTAGLAEALSSFTAQSSAIVRDYRRKTEVMRTIWPYAAAFEGVDVNVPSLKGRTTRVETLQNRVATIAEVAVFGVKDTPRERRRASEALSPFGRKFDEDTVTNQQLVAAVQSIVADLSVPMSESEAALVDRLIREMEGSSFPGQIIREAAETLGWRMLPIVRVIVQAISSGQVSMKIRLLSAVVGSGVSVPADRSAAVASAVDLFNSLGISMLNHFEDFGTAIGSLGAPAIAYFNDHARDKSGTGWTLLVANAVGRALNEAFSTTDIPGDVFERFRSVGITPANLNTFTRIATVELHNNGGTYLGAPHLFRNFMETAVPLGVRNRNLEIEQGLDETLGDIPDVNLVEFLGSQGVALTADGAAPSPSLVLGRTIYFTRTDGQLLALKFLRDNGELPNELLHESRVQSYLQEHKAEWGLKSDIPSAVILTPAGLRVGRLSNASAEVADKLATSAVPVDPSRTFIAYVADPSYTVYVQNAPDPSKFDAGIDRALNDLAVQARHGVVHNTIFNVTHTLGADSSRADRGTFLWNVDLLPIRQVGVGTGDIPDPEGVLRYGNIRESGEADLGDVRAYRPKSDTFPPAFNMAYYLGSYLLAASQLKGFQMINGGRLRDWKDASEIKEIADWHLDRFSKFAAAYSGLDEGRLRAFLADAVDWNALAREMIFFMGRGPDGRYHYYKHVALEEAWPENIYPDAKVVLNTTPPPTETNSDSNSEWRDFIPGVGWANPHTVNGREELRPQRGPTNGPFDIQELIRALYVVNSLMVAQTSLEKAPAEQAPSMITRGTFAAAIRAFMRYGILGRPTEWKIAVLASVRESLLAFAGPLFQAAHDNNSQSQARWRIAGQIFLTVAAVIGAIVALTFFNASPDISRFIAAIAGAWLGSVTFHLAWDLAPLAFGRSNLTREQRSILSAAQAARSSGIPENRRAVENLLAVLPQVRNLGVANGPELHKIAGYYLSRQIREGRRPSQVLPELEILARTPEGAVAQYDSAAKPADSAKDSTVNVRVIAAGTTRAEILAEVQKELLRRTKTEATDTLVFAISGEDASAEASLALDLTMGPTIRFVRNDKSLNFQPEILGSRLGLPSLKKLNVFLAQNSALSPEALESLKALENMDSHLASIYLLIESATRIAVPVTTTQLSDMIRLRVLIETQA